MSTADSGTRTAYREQTRFRRPAPAGGVAARRLRMAPLALAITAIAALGAAAAEQRVGGENLGTWLDNLLAQLTSPLFWFGMSAQGLFFMRFFWQWLVSERRKRSTIPIVFWYFSLGGGMAMFVYGCLRVDLVIMLGQLMACVIYLRNLMLIYGHAARRRQAGFPVDTRDPIEGGSPNGP